MEPIINRLKELVLNMVKNDLEEFYTVMYRGIDTARSDMTITPADWLDGAVWSFMEQIVDNVMVPIAGLILTFILVVELYHEVIEKNAMKEVHMPTLFMYFFKMAIGVLIVSNATTIVNGLFDLGNWAVTGVFNIVPTSLDTPAGIAQEVKDKLDSEYDLGICFVFWLSMFFTKLIAHAVNIIAVVVVYGRLLQMTIYASFSPVPLATFMNKDWNVGQNYIKNLLALAFQGVLIIFIFGVYAIVVANPSIDTTASLPDLTLSIYGHLGWGVLLIMMLTKTNSITQSIFGAH